MKQAFTNTTNKKTSGKPLHLKARGNVRMPVCRYGAACMYRKSCIYRHPATSTIKVNSASAKICLAFISGKCTFGPNCHDSHPEADVITKYKEMLGTKPCKFGHGCKTDGCLYQHPEPIESELNVHASNFLPQVNREVDNAPTYYLNKPQPSSSYNITRKKRKIPVELWVNDFERSENVYFIQDSMEKFSAVNQVYSNQKFLNALQFLKARVIDLHYQTTAGCEQILDAVTPKLSSFRTNPDVNGVWIITGTGHHVAKNSHQRRGESGESILLTTCRCYLESRGIGFEIGVDNNGNSGALYLPTL